MKKLHDRQKLRLIRAGKKKIRRETRRRNKASVSSVLSRSARIILEIPEHCDISGKNRDEFLALLNDMQRIVFKNSRSVKLDFKNCKTISSGAALVLAAEVQRAKYLLGSRLFYPVTGTYPESQIVFATLSQIGFFDFLDIKAPPDIKHDELVNRDFILMRNGIGQNARASAAISDFASSKSASINSIVGRRIVSALNESLENAREHAYFNRRALVYPACGARWWMAGYHDRANGSVHLFMYDQGLSIPATLPRFFGSKGFLRDALQLLSLPFEHDGDLIRLAANLARTRSGKPNRGKGIQDILNVLKAHGNGQLLIQSRGGRCVFEFDNSRDSLSDPIRANPSRLPNPLNGTYIEWLLKAPECGNEYHRD